MLLACSAGCAWALAQADRAAPPARSAKVETAAAQAKGDKAVAEEASAEEAEVVVANRTVAILRGTFMGIGPERRALRSRASVRELMAQGGEGKVTVRVEPQGHVLLIDDQFAMIMVDADADHLSGQTLAQASEAARSALQLALDETREGRRVQRLLHSAGIGLLATLSLASWSCSPLARAAG